MTKDSTWFQERVKDIYRQLTKPIIKEIIDAVDQGLIRTIDPDLLAYALTGLIETMSFRMTLDNTYTFDKIIQFLMDFLMKGVPVRLDKKQKEKIQKFIEDIKIQPVGD
jgi:hypothetical protein